MTFPAKKTSMAGDFPAMFDYRGLKSWPSFSGYYEGHDPHIWWCSSSVNKGWFRSRLRRGWRVWRQRSRNISSRSCMEWLGRLRTVESTDVENTFWAMRNAHLSQGKKTTLFYSRSSTNGELSMAMSDLFTKVTNWAMITSWRPPAVFGWHTRGIGQTGSSTHIGNTGKVGPWMIFLLGNSQHQHPQHPSRSGHQVPVSAVPGDQSVHLHGCLELLGSAGAYE